MSDIGNSLPAVFFPPSTIITALFNEIYEPHFRYNFAGYEALKNTSLLTQIKSFFIQIYGGTSRKLLCGFHLIFFVVDLGWTAV